MFPVQHTDAELCSYCLTGHGPEWREHPEPDWAIGRWLMRARLTRWMFRKHTE
jgi:hypothetical protein